MTTSIHRMILSKNLCPWLTSRILITACRLRLASNKLILHIRLMVRPNSWCAECPRRRRVRRVIRVEDNRQDSGLLVRSKYHANSSTLKVSLHDLTAYSHGCECRWTEDLRVAPDEATLSPKFPGTTSCWSRRCNQ